MGGNRVKIKKSEIILSIPFYFMVIYTLMSSFLFGYITPYCKYIFLIIVLAGLLFAVVSKRVINTVGSTELALLIISTVYVVFNATISGGLELLSMSLSAYIIYVFPILLFPYIQKKINWDRLIHFLVFYGVVDSVISIVEFVTRHRLFPLAGLEGDIDLVTSAGAHIVRTYGLQGSFFIIGDVLCLCGFSAWYIYRNNKSIWGLVSWLIITVGVFSTGSRGYYVAYFFGMLVMLLAESKIKHVESGVTVKKMLLILFIILAVILGYYIVFFSTITFGIPAIDTIIVRVRMIGDWTGDSANLNRMRIWTWAYDYWMESFLTGHGACSTQVGYSGYISVTESGVLKRLVELGAIGTTLVYAALFYPLFKGLKKIKKYRMDPKVLIFIGVVSAYLIEDCILQRYTSPAYTIILWFSVAYIAYANKAEETNLCKRG